MSLFDVRTKCVLATIGNCLPENGSCVVQRSCALRRRMQASCLRRQLSKPKRRAALLACLLLRSAVEVLRLVLPASRPSSAWSNQVIVRRSAFVRSKCHACGLSTRQSPAPQQNARAPFAGRAQKRSKLRGSVLFLCPASAAFSWPAARQCKHKFVVISCMPPLCKLADASLPDGSRRHFHRLGAWGSCRQNDL